MSDEPKLVAKHVENGHSRSVCERVLEAVLQGRGLLNRFPDKTKEQLQRLFPKDFEEYSVEIDATIEAFNSFDEGDLSEIRPLLTPEDRQEVNNVWNALAARRTLLDREKRRREKAAEAATAMAVQEAFIAEIVAADRRLRIQRRTEEKIVEYEAEAAARSAYDARPKPQQASETKRRRIPARSLNSREKAIRAAIRKHLKGNSYCKYLDGKGFDTLENWRNDKDNPCPKTHVLAYDNEHWRELIQKEKSRASKRMKLEHK